MATLARAIEIAVSAHAGQLDKAGRPYILHPMWVMHKVRHLGDEYMIVAILHDVVEDTDWTIEKLRTEQFSEKILHSLSLLDFRKQDYHTRIQQISFVDLAKQVKMRDLEHNSKITRLKGLTGRDMDRMMKYHKAYKYLKDN